MPKSHGKISALPSAVRTEINLKIQEGWRLVSIAQWLLTQTAPTDIPDLHLTAGQPYALLWSRESDQSITPQRLCERALSRWYTTAYPVWLRQQAEREEFLGLVERAEQLGAAVGEKDQTDPLQGVNRLIRSLLFEAITKVRNHENNSADIARLTHAWARVYHISTETEKFKLQNQKAIDVGLKVLTDELKRNPKALEAFRAVRAAIKGPPTNDPPPKP